MELPTLFLSFLFPKKQREEKASDISLKVFTMNVHCLFITVFPEHDCVVTTFIGKLNNKG